MKDSDLIFGLMASFGKNEYSIADLMHLTKPFNVTESSLRTNLSRMKKDGILTSRKESKIVYYSFYKRGKKMNLLANLSFNPPEWKNWKNNWLGVFFTIDEQHKEKRYQIRKKLQAYRFVPQYPGLWIRPFNPIENKKYNFVKIFNNEYCKLVYLNYSKALTIKEVQNLWEVNSINKLYNKGINLILQEKEKLNNINPENALKIKMELGNEIVKLLLKDPLLPHEFLPDNWKGHELRKQFFIADKLFTNLSKPYWEKIFN